MSKNLFNTPFEMELRSLLLLSVLGESPVSIDRVVILDFISCYGADFELAAINLHGNNRVKFGEISNRRSLLKEAIKTLVVKGMVDVTVDRGYLFSISDVGKKYVDKFECEYSEDYLKVSKEVVTKYKDKSDEELMEIIQSYSLQSIRG